MQSPSWKERGGNDLEPALGIGDKSDAAPVRLVDARYIIKLAREGSRFPRRQDAPENAFVSLDKLRQAGPMGNYDQCLNVIVVSHTWMEADHPDPEGLNLKLLASALEDWLKCCAKTVCVGVFLDYMSLHQKPKGGKRTDLEDKMFKAALGTMSTWYVHQNTVVFKLTQLPAGRSDPSREYMNRGWCFFEAMMSSFSRLVLDLSRFSAGHSTLEGIVLQCEVYRPAPLPPDEFRKALNDKNFTNGADKDSVANLYKKGIEEFFVGALDVRLSFLNWTDSDVDALVRTLYVIDAPRMRSLHLRYNLALTKVSIERLTECIRSGRLPCCSEINLEGSIDANDDSTAIALRDLSEVVESVKY